MTTFVLYDHVVPRIDHRTNQEDMKEKAKFVNSPCAAAHPAVLVTTACASHVLTAGILFDVSLTLKALGDRISGAVGIGNLIFLSRTRHELAVVEVPTVTTGVALADLALDP